jgi:hypothetical protein
MAKNVAVCCDGTANEFATDHTNVLKLFRVLDNDPIRQVAFYHPGVGTMEAVGALTSVSRNMTKFLVPAQTFPSPMNCPAGYPTSRRFVRPLTKLGRPDARLPGLVGWTRQQQYW